ncbi:MAG: TlpA disulfide reductase family protein [Acidobacteriota bacterium]
MRWIAMLTLLLATIGLKLVFIEHKDTARLLEKGASSPVFELRALDGAPYDIAGAYKNRRGVVLLFWATWCPPCRRELQAFKKSHEELTRQDIEVVAITDEKPEVVRRYVAATELPFTVLLDPGGGVGKRFGVSALPSSVAISRGTVLMSRVGLDPNFLESLINATRVDH